MVKLALYTKNRIDTAACQASVLAKGHVVNLIWLLAYSHQVSDIRPNQPNSASRRRNIQSARKKQPRVALTARLNNCKSWRSQYSCV